MIRKLFFTLFLLLFSSSVFAMLNLELTQGVAGAIPITVTPFEGATTAPQNISSIVQQDLKNSGRFKLVDTKNTADNVVTGSIEEEGVGRYRVSFQLREEFKGKNEPPILLLNKKLTVPETQLRAVAHHISDLIYQQMIGVRGIFSTHLAYVVVRRSPSLPTRYVLEVSDADGYNPRPLLTSTDPIMSPAWSPNGKQIAYVSFEKQRASIYVEEVATGARKLLSNFPGINGAPAWSPDGKKIALVLSKSGSPNIYLLDLATQNLSQLTQDYYINTEPAFSPNGRYLIFTSNRSGGPQIYQLNLATHAISRVTYQGRYNARASFAPDGSHIVMINQDGGVYNIGILDLDTGTFRVLTTNSGGDSDSPTVAPNGSMVLYNTVYHGKTVLGMSTTDGNVQLLLPDRNGEAQDPAWSPF